MADKKRHHYIPRFYLKRFSINNDGKFIGLYNLNNKKFIQNAPLKSQAYENFLYGEDDKIENALAEMEGRVAKMFCCWIDDKLFYPPLVNTNGFMLLARFILYQAYRTPKSGNDLMEIINQGLKTVLKEFNPELWKNIIDGEITHRNPVLLALFNAIKHNYLLNFLDCRFLVNLSLLPLITSDAPVVLYNHLMEQAKNYIGATGLAVKGLQIFYPIHPRLMICLYDPSVYDFGNGCINCCSIESNEEIHQLNGLQLINSNSQLFFDDSISEEYIKKLLNDFEEHRKISKNINKFINQDNNKYFFTSSENAQINLHLNFFKLIVDPTDYKNEIAPLRHPSLKRS